MTRVSLLLLAFGLMLAGCTHLGTNISGKFTCRAPAGDCQPVSVIDDKATRELVKGDDSAVTRRSQPVSIAGADRSRTGERTLRIVFPAHVDASGALHEEAALWAVVETPHWTGELRPDQGRTSGLGPLRKALRSAARRSRADGATTAPAAPRALPPEDSAPTNTTSPFTPASPLALPSPGGEAETGPRATSDAMPDAEGFGLPSPTQDRTPRPSNTQVQWPDASVIDAAHAAAGARPSSPAPAIKLPPIRLPAHRAQHKGHRP